MRFGLHVLLWIMLWYSAQQVYDSAASTVLSWLEPPQVEALSEWDADAMARGIICNEGIGFAFDTGNPDWAPKCWLEI